MRRTDETNIQQRLWDRIEPEPMSGCWLWMGARSRDYEYGEIRIGKTRRVHILVYELLVGPVPDGCELDHVCRVRPCVRPSHLEPVPHRINVLRGTSPAAQHATAIMCKRGHSLADAYVYDGGRRRCRVCHLTRAAGYYARRMDSAS